MRGNVSKLVVLGWAGTVLLGACAADAPRARVYRSEPGQGLTAASKAAPAAIVGDFLRGHGVARSATDALRVVSQHRGAGSGFTHVRLEQEVAGLRVANAYARATLNDRGQLIHLIDELAPVAGSVTPARIDERQALGVALRHLGYALPTEPAAVGRQGNTLTFAKDAVFYSEPSVERVAIPTSGVPLETGFLVETWTQRGNLLHHTLVDGDGRIRSVELRTNTDSYNVFTEDPLKTPQSVVAGPGAGNAESPVGWLFAGTQSTIEISGNNAHAYLDTDANNKPDRGGSPVVDGNFLSIADLTVSPSTSTNKNVGVQNLFFLNNVLHDTLYRHGFTEATGNFQEDNFGKGGRGGDPVNAEAQDGSGLDNANFATPPDGRSPRMQMFLWSAAGPDHEVVVHAPASIAGTYGARGAEFGPALTLTGITGDVVLVNDGTGTPTDACEAIQNAVSGKIALVDRGSCLFTVKVLNAQAAGAIAVIVINVQGDTTFTMGGTDRRVRIPSVMVGLTDGTTIKSAAGVNATLRQRDTLRIDGDLDSDIVYHEYGHGLTQRMIGGMSGPLAGAIGEGMSDTLAIILNEDDRVGEYAFSNPIGVRTAPYTNYPRTYGDIAGTEVHFDGEVYGAIGWRMFQIFQHKHLSKDLLLDYIVDGMNFTPSTPAFEDMRDGILQAVANRGLGHECLIWQAFASYGVGVGASGTVSSLGTVTIIQSFDRPPECK
ncbi:MAG TPA: M36 family metallopeptidase [Haliangiales bacterium]|nr:M36 family metallopeptidase [Haliangiales bacterium]